VPYGELNTLLIAIAVGLTVGIAVSVPVLTWRWWRKEPLIPRGTKLKSPRILYTGVALFSASAMTSLVAGYPLFASMFIAFASAYVVGIVAYRRGWRG
jgi:hypothetical protein